MNPCVAQIAGADRVRTPDQFSDHLDRKIGAVLDQLEQSMVYRLVADPATEPRVVTTLVKCYLLEVFSFVPHVTEATFTAIGRLPKNRPDLMRPMILHDLEEVDHGEMALQDYLRLGGDEHYARTRRISPASFVVGATCRMLAERENPLAYLGYMYFFEGLTPVLAERVLELLARKGFPQDGRYFIDFHAKADIGHARRLRKVVTRVVREYPDAAAAIEYGFECFVRVYPLPIWETALRQAREELALSAKD